MKQMMNFTSIKNDRLIEDLVKQFLGRKIVQYNPKFRHIYKWIEKKSIVIAGYFDNVKSVNLVALIGLWLDGDFAEYYPYASDYFQILVVDNDEDTRGLQQLLREFKYCPHLKVWVNGEEIPQKEYEDLLIC